MKGVHWDMNSCGGCSVSFRARWREQIRGNLSRDLQAVSGVTSFISNKMCFVFWVVKQSLKWGSRITYMIPLTPGCSSELSEQHERVVMYCSHVSDSAGLYSLLLNSVSTKPVHNTHQVFQCLCYGLASSSSANKHRAFRVLHSLGASVL